ncbi:MAG: cytochrome C [Ignavibacteriales bacterium]|nr:cytochrome C [Ignavibacteriales bacterium]
MPLRAQLSPGDLTRAHAQLEGLSNCTKCHTLGKQVENSKCHACHGEMQKLISEKHGYHSSPDVKDKKCETCHGEHHGRNFQIIRFDKKNFNHDKTGFQLSGKHQNTDCDKCHQAKNIKRKLSKKSGFTYLGLKTECLDCHQDFHNGSLGNNCSSCHSTEAFRPAKSFDHSKTKFQLTGRHLQVACEKCHPKSLQQGKTTQKFSGLQFGNCTPCHKDAHEGKLGSECKKCHTTSSFHAVAAGSFDHSKTNFPLKGKHSTLACEKCHTKNASLRLKHNFCIDCHKDEHNGRFITTDKKTEDCQKCHSINGFKPSSYTIEQHNRAKFPLAGSHLSIPCESCHRQNNSWTFTKKHEKCTNCHTNVHGNELSLKYLGADECEKCHNINSWKTISFNHDTTGFRLEGKHQSLDCKKCHIDKKNNSTLLFSSLESNCLQCHKDRHAGQFTENNTANCLRCHQFDNWQPTKFDHSMTNFMLKGAHENVPCIRCHKQVNYENEFYILYRLKEFKCANCHS